MSARPCGIVKVCPICNGKTKCIDTRESGEFEKAIRRRYKCLDCDYRYSTIEIPIEDYKRENITVPNIRESLSKLYEDLKEVME